MLKDCLSQFHGKLPRTEYQQNLLIAHLKRMNSWDGGIGSEARGIFTNLAFGPMDRPTVMSEQ